MIQQTQSLRKMNFGGDTVYGKTKEEALYCITTSPARYKTPNYNHTVVYFIPADIEQIKFTKEKQIKRTTEYPFMG